MAYPPEVDVRELGATLEAWAIEDIEPIAMQCQRGKFELQRRLAAENMAHGDYFLVDLGCVPKSKTQLRRAMKELYAENCTPVGMIGWTGARLCRKGVIDKWPKRSTESYDEEHKSAYESKGYKIITWQLYKRLHVS